MILNPDRGMGPGAPQLIVRVLRQIAGHFFPLLTADAKDPE